MADQNIKYKVTTTGTEKAQSQFKKIGLAIGAAFGTQQILRFGGEAIQLAAKLEGIKGAFDRLNQAGLLSELRKATRGTVTDLDLMKAAVQAKNFKIPLEELATFFQFATSQALRTGESVDFLVSSLVTGLGRKSVLILDNLGISAVELQKEVKKIGDFGEAAGNVFRRELLAMGDVVDTTATKIARLNATMKNWQTEVGTGLIVPLDNLTQGIDSLSLAIGDEGGGLINRVATVVGFMLTMGVQITTLGLKVLESLARDFAMPERTQNGLMLARDLWMGINQQVKITPKVTGEVVSEVNKIRMKIEALNVLYKEGNVTVAGLLEIDAERVALAKILTGEIESKLSYKLIKL